MIAPSIVYFFVWLTVIWLHSLQMANFYEPVSEEFVLIQIVVFAILAVSEIVIKEFYSRRPQMDVLPVQQLLALHMLNRKLLPLLVMMFLADSIWSGGFPLYWLAVGDGRTHVDFGIPTFHGAYHGILLFFVTSSFLLFRKNSHRKANLAHICLFLLYAIIVFNRGIVIIFMIQALFIYLIADNKVRPSTFVCLGILSAVGVLVFGILGDYRSGGNVFASAISDNWIDFFDIFPKSLMWFYVYTTGGLNNLYYNLPTLSPTHFPLYSFAKLVPTVAYDWMDIPKTYDSFSLADGRLTVSTAFQGLVSDFGILGIFGYLPILFAAQLCYRRALLGSVFSTLYYGMLMQTVVMTPYIDTVFYLTFLLQILLVMYCALRLQSTS